ncbi:MAG TPA: hydrogenase maturation protease [Chloroflexota bacterium]|nr:hydrogenase maturation protease [Chloroflexota bacterium]
MNTLVLGYGNPLRGDDGVGWVVAERLHGAAGITAVPLHQLLPEHADLMQTAVHVIFVDATVMGEPGAVQVQPLAPDRQGLAASHQMSPGVLLAMVGELYGRCPPAHLITITGQDFGYSETLSPPVQESVEQVIEMVRSNRFSSATTKPGKVSFRRVFEEESRLLLRWWDSSLRRLRSE